MLAYSDINVAVNAPHELYLEVNVNDLPTSLIVRFRELHTRLSASGEDLRAIGLVTDTLGIADSAEVELDQISGLRYSYDAAHQTVNLQIPDNLRKAVILNSRASSEAGKASTERGLVLNYDLYTQSDAAGRSAFWGEERYFDKHGVLSNSGIAYLTGQQNAYIRYDTSWSRSNPDTLSTIQLGDTISSSLTWSRSVRLGGFQWRSNFALRPDLVTFPMPSLSGTSVVPSAVNVYVNGVQQYAGTVQGGPFVINQVPGITGAGEATVVTRDALGRSISTSVPLYVDTRLLAPGLSSYSFEGGFLRHNYGVNSFDYNARPATSASARVGVSDMLTVEAHGEATSGLYNLGAGGLVRLGRLGVINCSVSGSAGSMAGTQLSLGYQYIQPRFSVNAQSMRAFGNYGDLGARDGAPVPTAVDSVSLSLPVFGSQSVGLSYVGYKAPLTPLARIGSLSYSTSFPHLIALNLSVYQDLDKPGSRGISLGLSIAFDGRTSINTNSGQQNGHSSFNVNATRSADYDGGWGWAAQSNRTDGDSYQQAQVQYLGKYGQVTALAQNAAGKTSATVDVGGALVLMDGSIAAARRIGDGFALVSTDGVPGIPVLHENRVIGTTDASGHLLIPDLHAYQNNRVAIDPARLPSDARLGDTMLNVVPLSQSGVTAHFPVQYYSAASVILNGPDGQPLPVGARVRLVESGKSTVVGYDGLSFIEDLKADNHLLVDSETLHCAASFPYHRSGDGSLTTIGPLICHPTSGRTP